MHIIMVEFSKFISKNKTILFILFCLLIILYIIYGKYNLREGNSVENAKKRINKSKELIKNLLKN
jgi:hypothetical protein